jgi:hypothetical protein
VEQVMKKLVALALSSLMVFSFSSQAIAAEDTGAISANAFAGGAQSVVWLTNNDVSAFDNILSTTPETIDEFFDNQGILVITGENGADPTRLDSMLNIPVEAENSSISLISDNDIVVDPGIDIANIYYQHNGVFAVHEINVGTNDTIDREPFCIK